MKFIHVLFVLYLSALTVYPCFETDCLDECSALTEQGTSEEQETCSPFCMSICCSAHVYPVEVTILHQPTIARGDKNIVYTETSDSTIQTSIWQPPKLS